MHSLFDLEAEAAVTRQELHLDTFDQETVHLDMLNMT